MVDVWVVDGSPETGVVVGEDDRRSGGVAAAVWWCSSDGVVVQLALSLSPSQVKKLLELYSKEKYILVLNQQPFKDFEILVSFKDGATSLSVLRSVWQAYWFYKNQSRQENMFDQLQESLKELDHQFDKFLQQLRDVGWDINSINLKVNKDVLIEDFSMY